MSLPDNSGAESLERMMEEMRQAISLGTSSRRLGIGLLAVALIIPNVFIVLTSLSSESVQAGWLNPRELVTDGIDYDSSELSVAADIFGNVHVVWSQGGNLDGSGPDPDIFLRKWNATTGSWEGRLLITDDNLNNTRYSGGTEIETDSFGNVHVAWVDSSDLNGSGTDTDIFQRMWNASTNSWGPAVLVSDDPENTGSSTAVRLAADPFGNIHVAWHDKSPLDPHPGIQYRKWNGTTRMWEGRMVVSVNQTGFLWPDIAADYYGNAHVLWEDKSNISGASSYGNDTDIFYRRLDASSNSWGSVFHVNDDDESDQNHSNRGGVSSDPHGNVHLLWEDLGEQSGSGPDSDLFYRKWSAASRSWEARVLLSNDPANTGSSSDDRMCTDPLGNLHVIWRDKSDVDGAGSNYGDVFYKEWNAITDVWENTNSLTNDLMDQYLPSRPDIACDGLGNLAVAWNDMSGLLGSGPDYDVYLLRYESETILPDYVPVEVSPSPAEYVLIGSKNAISAKVYNGGNASSIISAIAFYNTTTPSSPFFRNSTVPPLEMSERSSPYQAMWEAPPIPGLYEVTIEVDYGDYISEISENNNFLTIRFFVERPSLPPPANLTAQVIDNDDIFLNWTVSNSTSIDHYLIYRSTDHREFDFSTPAYDTSADTDSLRTNWTDVDAANLSAPKEFYYVVRAVNGLGNMSITSNTAGKWTKEFPSGLSSFSLALEPFEIRNVSWFADNIPNTRFIRWMDSSGHWVTHHRSMAEGQFDVQAQMGRGYEISLSPVAKFTFCGSPASMIRFQEGLGESVDFRKSLTAQKSGTDVVLGWNPAGGSTEYRIFVSNKRNGLHDMPLQPVASVPSAQTTWTDTGVLSSPGEHYYMVIPVDSQGELGSGTYNVGVVSIAYSSGSDTFALPLKPIENHSLDWYCDVISDVAGMSYSTLGEWKYHAREMPSGVYDRLVQASDGYQLSISGNESRRYEFIGW
jgi:hypothetical protein